MAKEIIVAGEEIPAGEADRFHELREKLLELSVSATQHFFEMGKIMKEIRDKELWKMGYESFGAFYSDPEFDFKKSSVYHAIRLVELLPEWQKFIDIPTGKLVMIAAHITDENRNELINMARTLSRSDLQHQLIVKRIAEVSPRLAPLAKIYPCSRCGKARGITFDGLCHCGWTSEQIALISKAIEKIELGGE